MAVKRKVPLWLMTYPMVMDKSSIPENEILEDIKTMADWLSRKQIRKAVRDIIKDAYGLPWSDFSLEGLQKLLEKLPHDSLLYLSVKRWLNQARMEAQAAAMTKEQIKKEIKESVKDRYGSPWSNFSLKGLRLLLFKYLPSGSLLWWAVKNWIKELEAEEDLFTNAVNSLSHCCMS